MIIDHIGIVVKDIEKGIEHWGNIFGYSQMTKIVTNTRQKVKVVFLKKENSDRKSVVQGKSVDLGGRRIIKKKNKKEI